MRRHAIGIIAVGLLAGAAGLWLWLPGDDHTVLEAAFWRVGAVMAVFWLAYPDVRRLPAWALALAPLALVVVAIRPRRFVYLLPVLAAIAFLQWLKRPSGGTK
ncbi:MAG: hypothetical protein JW888_11465 [Pirellulales bacterium]|nr:hypothetical protein [Pirellulales bacterium]